MVNKPKFNIFANIGYAMDGMIEVLKNENSFKMQLLVITLIGITLPFIDISTLSKLVLFVSTWLVLLVEAINSAIERVVDLVTTDYHKLAKDAKDIGAFAVLIAFVIVVMVWGITISIEVGII